MTERNCRAGLPVRPLERMASREDAAIIFSRKISDVSDSTVASHTEPVHAPDAPSAMHAAIWRPVAIPPAASTGTSRIGLIARSTSGISTSVETSLQWPPFAYTSDAGAPDGIDIRLIRLLAAKPALRDLAITSNGVLLAEQAAGLREAGLHRVTVSLDTLRPERFAALTRRDTHAQVLEGLAAVTRAGFADTKIDTVVMRGTNDDELADLIEYGKRVPAEVRFIEYMDVGGATRWSMDKVVSRREMLARLEEPNAPLEQVTLRPELVVRGSTAPPRSISRRRASARPTSPFPR